MKYDRWYNRKSDIFTGLRGTKLGCTAMDIAKYKKTHTNDHHCDEFPFLQTLQGGPVGWSRGRVSLRIIDASDNSGSGSVFGAFIPTIKKNKKKRFMVLGLPNSPATVPIPIN